MIDIPQCFCLILKRNHTVYYNRRMTDSSKKKVFSNVVFIGLMSFFGGISQDIFVPVLPLYLANVLHFDKSFIGLTEGLVTASASIFKIVAGYLSDTLRKNKP